MRMTRLLGPVLAFLLAVPAAFSVAEADPAQPPQPPVTAKATSDGRLTAVPRTAQDDDLLAKPLRSKAALRALGPDVKAAAEANDMSSARFTRILSSDPSAWVSTAGRIFYADEATQRPHGRATDIPPATMPLGDTFLLHSKQGSEHTIYLDFNGVTLANGAEWLSEGFTKGPFKGFSIDANYATFSTTEQEYIQHVWRIVSEKYAAFDVDVTTADPGPGAYNRDAGPLDPTYGDVVVFTGDPAAKPDAACPSTCSGVAFLDTFDDVDTASQYEPAWVYTAGLSEYPADVANTAAHEIGHTLGLEHDGRGNGSGQPAGNDRYYAGHGFWYPIMGSGLNAVSQFSKGDYTNASQHQDDLAVIAANGLPERPDDWGDVATPSALGQQTSYSVTGVVENRDDVDAFTVVRSCAATFRVAATGIGEGQALDLQVTVKDSTGNVLASHDAESGQDANPVPAVPYGLNASTLVADAPAGTYQVEVDGVAGGTRAPSTGYDDYGSIGQYTLAMSGCSGASGQTPAPPLKLQLAPKLRTTTATLTWNPPTSVGDGPVTGYRITGTPEGTIDVPTSTRSRVLKGLVPGSSYEVEVSALNAYGAGGRATTSAAIHTYMPTTAPRMTLKVVKNKLSLSWFEPPNPGHAVFEKWSLTINGQLFESYYGKYSGLDISGFGNGVYRVSMGLWGLSALDQYTPSAKGSFRVGASAPRIGKASSGAKGKSVTVTARWATPSILGGYAITGYRVLAYKLNKQGRFSKTYKSKRLSSRARAYKMPLPAGRYKLVVFAYNAIGDTDRSGKSKTVTAR